MIACVIVCDIRFELKIQLEKYPLGFHKEEIWVMFFVNMNAYMVVCDFLYELMLFSMRFSCFFQYTDGVLFSAKKISPSYKVH